MIYARISDLIERFSERELVQLSDRDDAGEVNTAVVNRALADATALVNGYIGLVYQLPLLGCAKPATVPGAPTEYFCPPALTRIVCDLARYYLYTNAPDEHDATRRYKAAQAGLAAIAAGKTHLSCPCGGPPGVALSSDNLQANEVMHSFAPRQINDDSLRGFA
jgi:phage gp36-like protein